MYAGDFFSKARFGKNSLSDNFHGAGESTTDFGMEIVRGRIPGCVAILWKKKLDSLINMVRLVLTDVLQCRLLTIVRNSLS